MTALEERYVMQTYKRAPVEFVLGEGVTLYDRDGEAYLDFLAGISVCNAGHRHRRVVDAVRQQATRLFHVSNLFYTEPGVRLAERLAESFQPGARAFLCNSGAEANEAAISSRASTGAAARSWCSRTPSTAARWARAVGDAFPSRNRSSRSFPGSCRCPATTRPRSQPRSAIARRPS